MKIFNLGLPRTGTTSFHNFLLKNKIKSIHTNDGLIKYIYPAEYYKFKNNEPSFLDYFIENNDAFSDLPWYSLSDELLNRYKKNALFFATTRDAASWVKSIKKIKKHMFEYEQISNYHFEAFNGIITKNSTGADELLLEFFKNHNNKLIQLSKSQKIEIEFLDLNDTKNIVRTLKNKINIINEEYPKTHTNYLKQEKINIFL